MNGKDPIVYDCMAEGCGCEIAPFGFNNNIWLCGIHYDARKAFENRKSDPSNLPEQPQKTGDLF